MAASDLQQIGELVHTALYDTGGELVEGGFVDHWESNAGVALNELAEVFRQSGLWGEAEVLIRTAVRAPEAPPGAAAELVGRLLDRKSTRLNSSHLARSRMPSSA